MTLNITDNQYGRLFVWPVLRRANYIFKRQTIWQILL